jgi:ubiquinone/menaquinone biosynthesis C-methylase UbiE
VTTSLLFDVGAVPYAVLTSQPTWRAHGGRLAELLGARATQRVLDLGCGPGESAFGMIERVPGLFVQGLDLSPTMIKIARLRRVLDRAGQTATFDVGDAGDLPYADASFDGVTGHSFLYLLPDAARVLAEVRRVLAPGAKCAFLEPAAGGGSALVPWSILSRAPREPRFVTSMALWRIVSRRYGRFTEERFRESFEAAGLELVSCRPALDGLGMLGVGRRPTVVTAATGAKA